MPVKTTSPTKQKRIQQLARQGLSSNAIAKDVGVHWNTVERYLHQDTRRQRHLQTFNDTIGESITENLLLGTALQHKLLINLLETDVQQLSVTEQRQIVQALGTVNGIAFDKKRLHEGKSTSNTSHRIVLDQAHQARNWVESSKGKTSDITATSENPQ